MKECPWQAEVPSSSDDNWARSCVTCGWPQARTSSTSPRAGLGSKAKISRIETGKGPVRVADIRALCWLYGADNATTDALAALAPGTQQEDWWEAPGAGVVPDWFSLYAGLEATAPTHPMLRTAADPRPRADP